MKAYEHLYQRYFKALVIFAMKMLNDEEQCEDIVQDVIIALWQKESSFQSLEQFEAYLYNSVKNKIINEIRHGIEKDKYTDYAKNTTSELDSDDAQITEDLYAQLFHAIDQLPEKQQQVILMAMEGKSNADMAEAMGLSIETIKTHRKLALRKLRDITKEGIFLLLLALLMQVQ